MSTCQPGDSPSYARGCSTSDCCDSSGSCLPNVQGPCVCFTYGEALSGGGWNYTFIATCSGNKVSTTSGAGCYTKAGQPYVCYCRPKTSADRGQEGDSVPGNWIFSPDDECRTFPFAPSQTSTTNIISGSTSTASAVSATTSGPATQEEALFSSSLLLFLAILQFLGF
jgi:hypothetical protein